MPTFAEEFPGKGSTTGQCAAVDGEIMCYQNMHEAEEVERTRDIDVVTAMSSSADPDTMYYHEAMKQPDRKQFVEAVKKEFGTMVDNGLVEIVPKSEMPEGANLFPAVWAMKRKRRVLTGEVYKYKARMNLDGSKQREGLDYDETYAPVAQWESIRLLLALILKNGWSARQLDYVLAFPQAPVERDCYMKIPKGIEIQEKGEWVLKVKKNIYGQKQAGRVWNKYLIKRLKKIGFVPSDHDECIFYRGNCIYLLYTDDSILAGPCNKDIDQVVQDLRDAGINLTDEGTLQDFLGVNID